MGFLKEHSRTEKQKRRPDANHSSSQKSTSPTHSVLGLRLSLGKSQRASSPVLSALNDLKTKKQEKQAVGQDVQETRPESQNLEEISHDTGEGEVQYTWLADGTEDPIPDEYRSEEWTWEPQGEEEEVGGEEEEEEKEEEGEEEGKEWGEEEWEEEKWEEQDTSEHTYHNPDSSPDNQDPKTGDIYWLAGCISFETIKAIVHRHTSAASEDSSPSIPPGPYAFFQNPRHPAPEKNYKNKCVDCFGLSLHCPDACSDCEVFVTEVTKAKAGTSAWFDKHFTPDDAREANKNHEYPVTGPIPIFVDNSNPEEYVDLLYGATDYDDFARITDLHLESKENKRGYTKETDIMENMQTAQYMYQHQEDLHHYHGTRFNAILYEYEPRYIPHDGYWVYDRNKPIWEARGAVGPGQEEDSRQQCMRIEYERQWVMYHLQDDARRRYIAKVMSDAAWQYYRFLFPSPWQQ